MLFSLEISSGDQRFILGSSKKAKTGDFRKGSKSPIDEESEGDPTKLKRFGPIGNEA
jgi:hypothetical protein